MSEYLYLGSCVFIMSWSVDLLTYPATYLLIDHMILIP